MGKTREGSSFIDLHLYVLFHLESGQKIFHGVEHLCLGCGIKSGKSFSSAVRSGWRSYGLTFVITCLFVCLFV